MRTEEASSRRRMLRAAAQLLQRQGYHATGLRQLLAESDAPRGSLYFHFPGGKEQLAAEAVREEGARVAKAIGAILAAHPDPAEGVRAFVGAFAEILRRSDFRDGCPVATVTLDAAAGSASIREACDASFCAWHALVRDHLRAAGFGAARAGGLATLVLSAFEGALVLARARRDVEPLARVAEELAPLLARSLPRAAATRRRARRR
jgi:TetR/AcrR family transcriptional repressor of lmrAB and yxaGH operons